MNICPTCKWYEETGDECGECHLNPPCMALDDDGDQVSMLPFVCHKDYCSKWEHAPLPPPPGG